MRILLTLTILLTHYLVIGQSACTTYSGDYNKILSALKSKNTLSGNDKLFNTELEQIAKYWKAACSCEKGVKTREEANKIYLSIPASVPVAQYMYHGKMIKKKVDHFGDLIPTQKVYTTSSCMTGSSEPIEIKSSMDCTSEAANFYRTASDKQQYGKAFFRAYCECKNGVSRERRTQLIAEMKINHKHYHEFKATSDPIIQVNPLNDCAINSSSSPNNKPDKFSIYEDPLINSEVQGFIHDLAANSNNPDLKTLSKELQGFNDVQNDVNEYRSMLNITPSQQDLQFDQVMTNTAQVVSIIKFLVNSTKDKEIELTPSQKQAQAFMWETRNKIKLIYDESRVLPKIFVFNQQAINRLEEFERSLYVYDMATARERKLVINYFWNKEYMTLDELQQKIDIYNSKKPIYLIQSIDSWQQYADYDHALYLANSDQAFALTKHLIKLQKAQCYREMGQPEKAVSILKSSNYNVSSGEAIAIIISSYQSQDYETVSLLFPIAKQYFKEHKPSEWSKMYSIDQGETNENLSLFSQDATLLLASGIYANIQNNNLTQAEIDLNYLKEYISTNKMKSENLVLGLQATILAARGSYRESLTFINKAIEKTPLNYDPSYNWLRFIKFNLLVNEKKYEEAHEVYNRVNANYHAVNKESQSFFNIYEFKYAKCELLFKQQDYETALYGLRLLETLRKDNKYHLLRSNIYHAQGLTIKSKLELTKIK